MRRRGDGGAGGLVLDVGVFDVVGFGVVLGVGVRQDAEGEVIAIIKGIVTDAGDTAEVADGFKRTAVAERPPPDAHHATQLAHARKRTATRERTCTDARHAAQLAHARKRTAAPERARTDFFQFWHITNRFQRNARFAFIHLMRECTVT